MIVIINNVSGKIRFNKNDYKNAYNDHDFIKNLYKIHLKPVKILINLLVNNPDDLCINIALRMKKGEKLDVHYVYNIVKLNTYDVHNIVIKPEYIKYTELKNGIYTSNGFHIYPLSKLTDYDSNNYRRRSNIV